MSNISAKPNPKFDTIFQKRKYKKDHLYKELIFFNKGRDAILFGLNHLKINKKDLILMPGYICASLVRPILDTGYKIEYYDINKDFSINLDFLKKTIKNKNISCMVIVHYFGLLTDIKKIYEICQIYNIELIEDYCHSFFSRLLNKEKEKFLTTKIYSIRKNIPVFDGGAIEISNINLKSKPKIKFFSFRDFSLLLIRSIEFIINKCKLTNLYSKFNERIKISLSKIIPKKNTQKSSIYKENIKYPSFMLSKYLADKKYLKTSCLKRINNYKFFLNELQKLGLNNSLYNIQKNSVPQFFPILIDSSNKDLFKYLRKNGIETIKWPNYEIPKIIKKEKSKFVNSNFLNENIILIPVHQSLSKNNCERIINLIKKFLSEK